MNREEDFKKFLTQIGYNVDAATKIIQEIQEKEMKKQAKNHDVVSYPSDKENVEYKKIREEYRGLFIKKQ